MGSAITTANIRKVVAALNAQPVVIDQRIWIHSSNAIDLYAGTIGSMFGVNFITGGLACYTPEWQQDFEKRIQ